MDKKLYITIVRGQLKSESIEENKKVHDMIFKPLQEFGRSLSAIGHKVYLNPQNPKEFLAIDTWTTLEGPQKLFSDPKVGEEFSKLFESTPEVTFWGESDWAGFYDK